MAEGSEAITSLGLCTGSGALWERRSVSARVYISVGGEGLRPSLARRKEVPPSLSPAQRLRLRP
eukprot:5722929-Prymnesium_polylepis.1